MLVAVQPSERRYNVVSDVSTASASQRVWVGSRVRAGEPGRMSGRLSGQITGRILQSLVRKTTGAWMSRADAVAARIRRVDSRSNFRWRVRRCLSFDFGEILTVALLSISRKLWCNQKSILSTLISGPIRFWPLFFEFLALLGSDTTVGGMGLDFVISEAKKYGLQLILSLSNNYHDFGGRPQYENWARAAGVSLNSDDDFYTNSAVKGYYKNHIKKVLTRNNTITGIAYKDELAIMAWELINEPRCQSDYSGKTLNGWVQEMASYLKSFDKRHLLEIGMEGFYGDSIPDRKQFNPGYQVGTDFISNNLLNKIDFTTIHAYPDQWVPGQSDDAQMQFPLRWMTNHWTDSKNMIKKPLIFSELGKSNRDPGYNINVRDSFLNTVYTNIYNLAKNGGTMGGALVWQLVAQGMEPYFEGYEVVLFPNLSTRNVIAQQSKQMTSLEHFLR
ncbi:hypothetical protein Dsin_001614 [Dipteronia sinensis]|uniref:mannan endo-1,4-beta-mannosidase n=1 Tax=Dipteronia sinensis TaxID=43782 RepID=A0AAE0EII3_9ROSI|nr:hypothetical protein Dsin_001614 [Dipteronia sinensis]